MTCCLLASLAGALGSHGGSLRLPALFGDGAVLQRGLPVPVWGWAAEGAEVVVKFAGQEHRAKANGGGLWRVALQPLEASAEGRPLLVSCGSEQRELANVRVGEVWLASGQSNMQWPVEASRPEDVATATAGPVPELSLFQVPLKLSYQPSDDVAATWQACTPDTVKGFSAVAFFFARELARELQVPVGIIASSWGGSRIEPWTPEEGFAAVPELAGLAQERARRLPGSQAYQKTAAAHLDALANWLPAARAAVDHGQPLPTPPAAPPVLALAHNGETGTYQAMIHPLAPYGLRGFIWYQGESNLADGLGYRARMEALIRAWRGRFGRQDAPFLFAQLAPFDYDRNRPGGKLPELWLAQSQVLALPHTGMAVINDIGDPNDIHPRNKSEVGRRLALLALRDPYGRADLATSGPLFDSAKPDGDTLRVTFRHAEGLRTRDHQPPNSFEVAGENGLFVPADAAIDGTTVVLRATGLAHPRQVRFAWDDTAAPNLTNAAGLPAPAFHSHWPLDHDLGPNAALGRPFECSDPNKLGWHRGLTDGRWDDTGDDAVFATGNDGRFPKSVTIDLGEARTLKAVRLGTPPFGSTAKVSVALATAPDQFAEIGGHQFADGARDRTLLHCPPTRARFVRVNFLGNHSNQHGFDPSFCFLGEVEVFE